mmetsp:Transcript_47432/g.110038  ORF Transcript_47432/g.110038 Transcript_47432/m.110038 type:complete len:209 (-) Transcript_47432:357-983(-)
MQLDVELLPVVVLCVLLINNSHVKACTYAAPRRREVVPRWRPSQAYTHALQQPCQHRQRQLLFADDLINVQLALHTVASPVCNERGQALSAHRGLCFRSNDRAKLDLVVLPCELREPKVEADARRDVWLVKVDDDIRVRPFTVNEVDKLILRELRKRAKCRQPRITARLKLHLCEPLKAILAVCLFIVLILVVLLLMLLLRRGGRCCP